MEWGEREDYLRERHREAGGPAPQALLEKPELPAHLLLYWSAFQDLMHDRGASFGGIAPITFAALDAWATRREIVGDAFERLSRMVRALDTVWIEEKTPKTEG